MVKQLLFLLLACSAVAKAQTPVAHVACAGFNGCTTSAINTTGANFIYINASYQQGVSVSIGDTVSAAHNSYTPLTAYSQDSTISDQLFYVTPTTVGSGHTFTITCTSCAAVISVYAFSGMASSSVFQTGTDVGTSNTNGTIQPCSPSCSTNPSGSSLIITGLSWGNPATASINDSFTISDQTNQVASANYGGGAAYLVQTSGYTINPTWTATGAGQLAVAMAAFKGTGAAGPTPVPSCSPGSQASLTSFSVTCTDPVAVPVMCYTTNGTTPVTNGVSGCTTGTAYSGAITISTTANFEIVAGGTGYSDSVAATYYYGIIVRPTLPQATVSLTLPTQGSGTCPTYLTGTNCIRNVPSGNASDFQAAINVAGCGDTIVLPVATYSGNFTIPSTSCSGWIEIQSANLASLPSPGNRVAPANATNMPVISTPNTSAAFCFYPNSNHWRLMGLEITTSASSPTLVFDLVLMGTQTDCGTNLTVASQLPNQIIFDRDYIFGTAGSGVSGSSLVVDQGIIMNAQAVGIVDSYCDGIVNSAFDTQCFLNSGNGTGPVLIQNNFIQAASENIMFGGDDPAIANNIPSDITIIGNLFSKTNAWFTAPSTYNVKNLLEIKNAQRVFVDGNVMQYDANGPQHQAILFRAVDQSAGCQWCSALDITYTHNLLQHVPAGIGIAPGEGAGTINVPSGRILIQNNVISDIECAYSDSGSGQGVSFTLTSGNSLVAPYYLHDIIIDHNSTFSDPTTCGNSGMVYTTEGAVGATINNLQITNDFANLGTDGIAADSCGNGSTSAICMFNSYVTGYIYNKDTFISTAGTPVWTNPATTLWTTFTGMDFTSASGTNPNISGNIQLTASSPSYKAGTDGKDIGVYDWACYNAETAAAIAGTFTQATYNNNCNLPSTPAAPVKAGLLLAKQAQ